MYQRARKLGDSIADAASFISLAEDQLEAFSVSMNALSLVDSKNSWMLIPVVTDLVRLHVAFVQRYLLTTISQTQKRQRLSRHIPESRYLSSKHDAEIVHLSAIEYESTLLRAQIDSIKRDPSLLSSPGMSIWKQWFTQLMFLAFRVPSASKCNYHEACTSKPIQSSISHRAQLES